jgi:hypothetical protein
VRRNDHNNLMESQWLLVSPVQCVRKYWWCPHFAAFISICIQRPPACLLLPWLPPCHYKEWYNFLSLSLFRSLSLSLVLVRCTTQEELELKFCFSLSLQFLYISGYLSLYSKIAVATAAVAHEFRSLIIGHQCASDHLMQSSQLAIASKHRRKGRVWGVRWGIRGGGVQLATVFGFFEDQVCWSKLRV